MNLSALRPALIAQGIASVASNYPAAVIFSALGAISIVGLDWKQQRPPIQRRQKQNSTPPSPASKIAPKKSPAELLSKALAPFLADKLPKGVDGTLVSPTFAKMAQSSDREHVFAAAQLAQLVVDSRDARLRPPKDSWRPLSLILKRALQRLQTLQEGLPEKLTAPALKLLLPGGVWTNPPAKQLRYIIWPIPATQARELAAKLADSLIALEPGSPPTLYNEFLMRLREMERIVMVGCEVLEKLPHWEG